MRSSGRILWIVSAIVAAAICATPTLLAWRYDADYLALAAESTAYRFFYAQRWLEREPTDLFLPQGYLTSFVHMIVYRVAVGEHPGIDRLHQAIQAWGVTSGLFWFAVLAVGLVAFMYQGCRAHSERAAVLLAAVAPLLCTAGQGAYYMVAPDYHLTFAVLAALTVAIFLAVMRNPNIGVGTAALLGIWAGLLASNKVSWLPFGLLALAPVVAAEFFRPRKLARILVVAALGSVAAFSLVHVLVYSGDALKVLRLAPIWWTYVQSFGAEPGYWEIFVRTYLFGGNLFWVILAVVLMSLVVAVRSRRRHFLILAMLFAVGAVAFAALTRRPAGTTTYETLVMLLALTAMLIGGWHYDVFVRRAGYLCLLALAGLAWLTVPVRGQVNHIATASNQMANRWELHREIMASGRPAVAVIPTNLDGFGSIEQALYKGLTLPGEQGILVGNVGAERIAPGLTIRVIYGTVLIDDPYPDGIRLALFERADQEPLTSQYPSVADAVRRAGDGCQERSLGPGRRVTICDVP